MINPGSPLIDFISDRGRRGEISKECRGVGRLWKKWDDVFGHSVKPGGGDYITWERVSYRLPIDRARSQRVIDGALEDGPTQGIDTGMIAIRTAILKLWPEKCAEVPRFERFWRNIEDGVEWRLPVVS